VVSGPAQIVGNRVTLTGAGGTVVIRAYTEPTRPFFPVAVAERSFRVIPLLSLVSSLESEIEVFPNPANSYLNIQLPADVVLENIQLNDLNGKTLIEKNTLLERKKTVLDIKSIPNGTYLLQLQTDKGVVNKKVLKQ
jgi:shikimate 5-dehydrogenase